MPETIPLQLNVKKTHFQNLYSQIFSILDVNGNNIYTNFFFCWKK